MIWKNGVLYILRTLVDKRVPREGGRINAEKISGTYRRG